MMFFLHRRDMYLVDGYYVGDDLEYLFPRHVDRRQNDLVAFGRGFERRSGMSRRVLEAIFEMFVSIEVSQLLELASSHWPP